MQSPNQKTEVHIHISENITYSIYHQNKLLLKENQVALLLENSHILGANPHIQKFGNIVRTNQFLPLYIVFPLFTQATMKWTLQVKRKIR